MLVQDYAQFGGKHCETGSLKNVLAHLGVTAPHTGRPFSEEMLLGIGGGVGPAQGSVFPVPKAASPTCLPGSQKATASFMRPN